MSLKGKSSCRLTPEKPIEKFIRLICENKASNALIYPEGQVSLGIKESRPVRENFSKALITRLIEEKIDFELVPVSYVNGAKFFEYHNEVDVIKSEEAQLKIKVHRPITADEIAVFLKKYDSKILNTYLRFNWLFNLCASLRSRTMEQYKIGLDSKNNRRRDKLQELDEELFGDFFFFGFANHGTTFFNRLNEYFFHSRNICMRHGNSCRMMKVCRLINIDGAYGQFE